MKKNLGAFIVPTGIGASIGGYAGDASFWARKFASISKLIVNPNVVKDLFLNLLLILEYMLELNRFFMLI